MSSEVVVLLTPGIGQKTIGWPTSEEEPEIVLRSQHSVGSNPYKSATGLKPAGPFLWPTAIVVARS